MNSPGTHFMYFLALVCPPGLDGKILSYKHWMKEHFGSIVALKSPSHITLIQPFWMDGNREKELLKTLQTFASDGEELEILLNGFSHFGKRVIYLVVQDNPSLKELQKQAQDHFVLSIGKPFKKDDRAFHPHITIASRDLKPGDFDKAWQHFAEKEIQENFRSNTLSLLKLVEGKWIVIGERFFC